MQLFAQMRPHQAVKTCSGGQRIPCANAPPLMRPAALSHIGSENTAPCAQYITGASFCKDGLTINECNGWFNHEKVSL